MNKNRMLVVIVCVIIHLFVGGDNLKGAQDMPSPYSGQKNLLLARFPGLTLRSPSGKAMIPHPDSQLLWVDTPLVAQQLPSPRPYSQLSNVIVNGEFLYFMELLNNRPDIISGAYPSALHLIIHYKDPLPDWMITCMIFILLLDRADPCVYDSCGDTVLHKMMYKTEGENGCYEELLCFLLEALLFWSTNQIRDHVVTILKEQATCASDPKEAGIYAQFASWYAEQDCNYEVNRANPWLPNSSGDNVFRLAYNFKRSDSIKKLLARFYRASLPKESEPSFFAHRYF